MQAKRHQTAFIAAFVALAAIGVVPRPAGTASHRITEPAPPETQPLEQECQPRAMRQNSCHIHRRETFEQLPKNDPALWDPHARQEYLEHRRERSRCTRSRSLPC